MTTQNTNITFHFHPKMSETKTQMPDIKTQIAESKTKFSNKEGKQVDTSTHASFGCRDDDNPFLVDLDDELLIPATPWSEYSKKRKRERRFSDECEFSKLLFENDFWLDDGYVKMKEKQRQETEDSQEVAVVDMIRKLDNKIEKLSQDLGELDHLEGELETAMQDFVVDWQDDLFNQEIEVDWQDDKLYDGFYQHAEIGVLYAELEALIQNVPFLNNELRYVAAVLADEAPSVDVEESLERADIGAPAIDVASASVTFVTEKQRKVGSN